MGLPKKIMLKIKEEDYILCLGVAGASLQKDKILQALKNFGVVDFDIQQKESELHGGKIDFLWKNLDKVKLLIHAVNSGYIDVVK